MITTTLYHDSWATWRYEKAVLYDLQEGRRDPGWQYIRNGGYAEIVLLKTGCI